MLLGIFTFVRRKPLKTAYVFLSPLCAVPRCTATAGKASLISEFPWPRISILLLSGLKIKFNCVCVGGGGCRCVGVCEGGCCEMKDVSA